MDLNVGQVIYLLSSKGDNIYPAQVVEKIKRKTIHEEITSYIVCLPDKDSTTLSLDDVNASIFVNLPDVREKLLEVAKSRIDSLSSSATKLESRFKNTEQETKNVSIGPESSSESDIATVDLGNGLVAKIDTSQL